MTRILLITAALTMSSCLAHDIAAGRADQAIAAARFDAECAAARVVASQPEGTATRYRIWCDGRALVYRCSNVGRRHDAMDLLVMGSQSIESECVRVP